MPALLSLDEVTKRYDREGGATIVLDRISLELEPCDFVAVRGRRGSGKTTLLRIAAGTEQPDAGSAQFQGRDLNRLAEAERADLLNRDFAIANRQGPGTRGLSVRDYVALPLLGAMPRVAAHRRAEAALARVGADDCSDQTWDMLSDGSRALVSVGHALVRDPKVVFADDPTAGLGLVEAEIVVSLLAAPAKEIGVAVLLASPELPQLPPAARAMSLSHGRLSGPARTPARVIDLMSKRPKE